MLASYCSPNAHSPMNGSSHRYGQVAFATVAFWLLSQLPTIAQTATLNFSSYVTVVEGRDPAANLSVRRTGNTNSAVTVKYGTGGSLVETATANLDYLPAAGLLAFAPGETNKELAISILPDNVLFEGTEQFQV